MMQLIVILIDMLNIFMGGHKSVPLSIATISRHGEKIHNTCDLNSLKKLKTTLSTRS